jgi:O-antigen/teichoic acid export membrane protein
VTKLRALARSDLGRRLALATVTSGVVWGTGTLATFAIGVVLARWLGPVGYGVYGSAIAIVTLLAVPAQLGLPLLAMREVAATRGQGSAAQVATIGWWFTVIVGAASAVLAISLWLLDGLLPVAPAIKATIPTAAALLPALALSGLAAGLLRGQERVVTSQLLDVLLRPLAFLAALLTWTHPLGAIQALGAQVVATMSIALLGLALFFRGLPLTIAGGARHLRSWTAAALPMTLLEAMRALEGGYAVLIVGHSASIADAGLLRVAIASSVLVSLPISLQNIVTGPFLARAHADGEADRLARIVASSTIFMSATVAAALLVLAMVGRWAIPFAFGDSFGPAYAPLMVLGANQLLTAVTGPNVMLLSMTGAERTVARVYIFSVLSAVIAALLLTPLFGVMGTAASMLVATAIRGVLLNRHAHQALGIQPSLWGAIALFARLHRPVGKELGR